jgi:phospholipase/carboxylesterase
VVASFALGSACRHGATSQAARDGILTARPQQVVDTSATGRVMLGLDQERDAILQLPKETTQAPVPLLVLLHGATQSAEDMFWYLGSTPDETGVAVLAPNSRDTTWDAIRGGFGEDVEFLNQALARAFETAAIDPARVSIGGFSDGASYALALGLINGDLFSGVVAFSPGFVVDNTPQGKQPRFFISHGTRDHLLPIDRCGRRIAAVLKERGYEVTFREFEGDHEIPSEIARAGLSWVANLQESGVRAT